MSIFLRGSKIVIWSFPESNIGLWSADRLLKPRTTEQLHQFFSLFETTALESNSIMCIASTCVYWELLWSVSNSVQNFCTLANAGSWGDGIPSWNGPQWFLLMQTWLLVLIYVYWLEYSPVRYPNWFISMFEFRSKLIQFNIRFKIISWKFNSKDYSILNNCCYSIKTSHLDSIQ